MKTINSVNKERFIDTNFKGFNCLGTLSSAEQVAKNIIKCSSLTEKNQTLTNKEDDYAEVGLLEVEFIDDLGSISSFGVIIELQCCSNSQSHFEVRTELFDEQGCVEVDTTKIASAHDYCVFEAINRIENGKFWRFSVASSNLISLINKKISFYISYIELSKINY